MTVNVGTVDRVIRAIIGVVLLGLVFGTDIGVLQEGVLRIIAIVAGFVMLVVAAVRICPLYSIFGFKTCKA